jgi:uncharacterized integral membrane protein
MRRFLFLIIVVPVAIVAILLSVANRQSVLFSLDPFNTTAPAWSVSLPLFVLLFAALGAGVVIGGGATWLRQGKWRKAARSERGQATRLKREADELRRRVEAGAAALPAPRGERDAA